MIKHKLELSFIFLILLGTTTDLFLGQVFQAHKELITITYLAMFTLAFVIFKKIPFRSAQLSQIPNVMHNVQPQLMPLRNLISSNDPLLLIRFFAAFLVFLSHMCILFNPDPALLSGKWIVLGGAAHTGMTIFFTLSGYLMCKAFLLQRYDLTKAGIIVFYKSRWIRIFPLMCFVAIFLFALQYPQVVRFDPLSLIRLLTFNYYGNTIGLNGIGAMWSLSVEFQYYLIAPFIFLLFNEQLTKNKIKGISIVVTAIVALSFVKGLTHHYIRNHGLYDPNFFSLEGNLPFFLIGFLFNYLPIRLSVSSIKLLTNDVLLLGAFIVAFYCVCYMQRNSITGFLIVSVLTGAATSALDSIRKVPVVLNKRKFSTYGILQILGVLSYGFYLWHSGIGYIHSRLLTSQFTSHFSYIAEISFVFIIVLFISLISYVLVEDRFNTFKPIYKKNQDTRNYAADRNLLMSNKAKIAC